jgi:hypothetical protein
MKRRTKRLLWAGAVVIVLMTVATVLWTRRFHQFTPLEAVQDLQAAAKARNSPRPVERYLEERYGPMTEPANRQRAFLDFFNIGHIEGLYIIVSHMPGGRKQKSIDAMAEWVAGYRRTMSPEEKAALNQYLRSDAGRSILQRAASEYLQKDVHFRAATAPVIQELMTTVSTVQMP